MDIIKKPRRNKRFLFIELAKFYGLHRNTVSRILKGHNLNTVKGAIGAIKVLEDPNWKVGTCGLNGREV